jgi:hypothetical protein
MNHASSVPAWSSNTECAPNPNLQISPVSMAPYGGVGIRKAVLACKVADWLELGWAWRFSDSLAFLGLALDLIPRLQWSGDYFI